jgi:type I restriction enzyme S subunit
MTEWRECTLRNVLGDKGYIRGPFGSTLKRGEMQNTGIPVYEQKNAIYNDRTFRFFINNEKLKELSRFQVKTNDLIISCSGTVGKISIIKDQDPKGIISQALLILRPDVSKIDLHFLYYLLSSRQGFELLTQASHGSVQLNIAERKVVESIPLLLPPLPEQRAIASVLSSLDDKIDLLHRQNKTLEAMAEALFRQWFVEDAEDTWEIGHLENLFMLQRGFDLPAQNRREGPFPVYAASGFNGCHDEYKVKAPGVTTGRSGILGNVFFIQDDFWPLNTSLYIKEFRAASPLFSYFLLKTLGLENFNAGSAVPTLNRNHVHALDVLLPPQDLIVKFENSMISNFLKIKSNNSQIKSLIKLRDRLLVKLISGEVQVLL